MNARTRQRRLSTRDMQAILDVTSALAAPFDLRTMLDEVVTAAKQVLRADRGSVWLHDPAADELVLEVATGILPVRVRSGVGLVGACARAELTAGDTFDPAVLDQGLLVVLGDATGHGIGPALSVTQMHAMLRIAFRLHTELALRAKGILMMRENGFHIPADEATRARFAELHYLERSIGKTGLLALKPMLQGSSKDLWQLHMLEGE